MNRRHFTASLAAATLAGSAGRVRAAAARAVLYNSVGDTVTHWDVDVDQATLTRRETVTTPSVVQYGWPHPSGHWLYLATTDSDRGSRGITGATHTLTAYAVGPDGALRPHGAPVPLRQRPIHASVDRSGRFILAAYNAPPHLSVHRLNANGTIGAEVPQPADLDLGIFCHQIQTLPGNRSVVMVTRGNNPAPGKPQGDPGALKLFSFADGRLSNLASIGGPSGHGGYGYGPRHLDFHPTRPWAYVLVELQNQLHMHRVTGDTLAPTPTFTMPVTERAMEPGVVQVAGAIHVHPRGHVLYASNRVSATTHPEGAFPFERGENSIAVFRINQRTGEPSPIQFADPHGFHVRAFTIDPSGRLLIAASLAPMQTSQGGATQVTPAGLSLFRIADDGRLDYVRRYEVDLASGVQQMWVRAMALPA